MHCSFDAGALLKARAMVLGIFVMGFNGERVRSSDVLCNGFLCAKFVFVPICIHKHKK